ncbi:hypothetical protein DL770_010670 [Monosporascus sp. CRB-9-2]|nr:hypothetical protein DL770_010670 [Monosporascus sp. CRB-9-2]
MATWRCNARPIPCITKTLSRAILSHPFSSSHTLPLAYDHHAPPGSDRYPQDAPIIFMHGLFGSKKNNRTVSKVLARDLKRHVFALDLRNHGESPHAPRHDYTAMAEDVAGFIHHHGLKDSSLIGHSMGAKTAMTLALSQPHLVGNLVSVDNAPVDATLNSSFAKYIQGMRKIEESGVTRQRDADNILQEFEPDPDQLRFEKPALFIRGTHSKYVPDEVIPLIGRFFPRFSLVDIEAGHWLISEKPQEFLQAVIEFLSPKE